MNVVSKLRQNSVVDLFSGAGGLSSAFERSGFHTVSAVDIDADCLSTLRATQQAGLRIDKTQKKFLDGTKLLQADIREVRKADLIPEKAGEDWRPDVLAGGPPCQPFSSAGAGLGLDDPRGQLFKHFVRLAAELRPRVVLFENVAGLVTAKGKNGEPGGVLEMIQQHFERIGYACRFELLNAADFGAAQRRVRLYMVATCDQALPKFPKPSHAVNGLNGILPWTSLDQLLKSLPEPCRSDIVRPKGKRAHELLDLLPGTGLKSNGIVEANRPSGHWGYRQDCFVADLNAPSRTIRAASTPDWIQTPNGLRRLTWLECAALQGFPEGWLFDGGRASRFRQIGNAVQGDIGQAIAHVIKGALDSVLKETPASASWPAAFHKRVRYTAMEARVNGAHRTAARELREQNLRTARAAS
ncbi:DNA cytosine methyltransferase [Polymorphobacter sp.]|uniref:DNA cytosine methyltransferase n=1 Tax=Polymorphobacter sp. TaxID=1909290 RepID=UPI003F7255DF